MMNGSILVRGVDISEGGMFVMSGRTFSAGEFVRLQFRILQSPVIADAEVQYSIANVGMGLRFTKIKDENRDLIRRYVEEQLEEKGPEKQKRVLLVGRSSEAGADMRIFTLALIGAGYKVVDAAGFEDAASILRKGFDFSCIILRIESETDINYSLLHLLDSMEHYRNIGLIELTNSEEEGFYEAVLERGVKKLLMRGSTSPKHLFEEVSATAV
jgi:PleD family two-component response regulator